MLSLWRKLVAVFNGVRTRETAEGEPILISFSSLSRLERARMILRDDLITPDEVVRARGLLYTEDQLRHFAETWPQDNVLRSIRNKGMMLIAGPSQPLNLLEVRELAPGLFYDGYLWYASDEDRKAFSEKERVPCEWLAVRKSEVPRSAGRHWDGQQEFIQPGEFIPDAALVAWAVTTFFAVRGQWIMREKYVRTSSVMSTVHGPEKHVTVGDTCGCGTTSPHGLVVGVLSMAKFGGPPSSCIGLASALRL